MSLKLEHLIASVIQDVATSGRPPGPLVIAVAAGILRIIRKTLMAREANGLPGVAEELSQWLLSLADPLSVGGVERLIAKEARRSKSLDQSARPDHPLIPLPPGTSERDRIVRAALKLSVTGGTSSVTVDSLRAEAGVGRRSLEAHFDSPRDAYLEAIGQTAERAAAKASHEASGSRSWDERVYLETLAICTQAAHDVPLANLVLIDVVSAGVPGMSLREGLVSAGAEHIRETAEGPRIGVTTSEASAAAAWQLAYRVARARKAHRLTEVAPVMGFLALTPMLGSGQAMRVVCRDR